MTMTTKHTPGPWTVTRHDDLPIGNIHHGPHKPGEVSVGAVSMRGNGTDEANARLIAAAPDLLAALSLMVDAYDAEWPPPCRTARMARAAIAKAEEG
jgi:hypothetical protein